MTRPRVAGIVLAGGRSTRFGSDKLAARVDGEAILHRAVRAVAQAADEVIVVVAPGALSPSLPGDLPVPVRVARDAVAGRGPLAGLAAGLAATEAPYATLVGGDQPWVRPDVLRALADEVAGGPGRPEVDVAALEDGDRLWPLPVALRVATARPAAEAALGTGDLRLLTLFGRLRVRRVPAARWRELDPDGLSLRDVDTRGDLPSG